MRVLIVDDDENINLFMSRLLNKKFQCKTETAKNGLEALTKIKLFKPELIFLDVTMPIMDGLEFLENMRKDEIFKKTPVVMLTAISTKEVIEKVMSLGILDYMLKPLMYNPTIDKITSILDKIEHSR
ncbi:MAG: response regulator [bacterium]